MKKLISSIALLLCAIMAQAADITEDFSTLAKGKYGAGSEQSVTLPSGEWMALKMELKENGGVKQFTFTSGTSSYLITPAIDDPGKIAVNWGSGGSNKLTISYSIDGGSWQELTQQNSGGSGAKSYSAKTNLDGITNVRFRFVGSSSHTYVSKVVIKSATVEPPIDDPTYITEGAWVPTKPFPTATKEIYIAIPRSKATANILFASRIMERQNTPSSFDAMMVRSLSSTSSISCTTRWLVIVASR